MDDGGEGQRRQWTTATADDWRRAGGTMGEGGGGLQGRRLGFQRQPKYSGVEGNEDQVMSAPQWRERGKIAP